MDTLFENYEALLARVSAQCVKVEKALSGHLTCRKGCASCCLNISLFPVEAVHLRMAFEGLDADLRASVLDWTEENNESRACPLLDSDGACQLYMDRPVICRTHGLPIFFVDADGNRRVDFCPENFQTLETISGDAMIDVDALNQMLAAVNACFCSALFDGDPPFQRLSIADALHLELA